MSAYRALLSPRSRASQVRTVELSHPLDPWLSWNGGNGDDMTSEGGRTDSQSLPGHYAASSNTSRRIGSAHAG